MADEEIPDVESSEAPANTGDGDLRDAIGALIAEQRAHRAEVAQLRQELTAQRGRPMPSPSAVALSPEQAREARLAEIAEHDFYCPGCGALYDYRRECRGRDEAPHPAIEVVSTDELKGENADDGSKHTAAPGVNP